MFQTKQETTGVNLVARLNAARQRMAARRDAVDSESAPSRPGDG